MSNESSLADRVVALEQRLAAAEAHQAITNNKYFVQWLTASCLGLYILFEGSQVIAGGLSLGMFLVDIQILKIIVLSR